MYLDILQKPIKYQGHRLEVKVTWFLCVLHGTGGQQLDLSEGFIWISSDWLHFCF